MRANGEAMGDTHWTLADVPWETQAYLATLAPQVADAAPRGAGK